MKPEIFKQLDDEYKEFPRARAEKVPTTGEIKDAENILGVSFHEDYIEFLLQYGAGDVGAYSIYGLHPAKSMGNQWSVKVETLLYRNDGWPYVEKWYVISNDGYGNPIGVAPDGKVMSYDHDQSQLYEVALNFEEFLIANLNVELEDDL